MKAKRKRAYPPPAKVDVPALMARLPELRAKLAAGLDALNASITDAENAMAALRLNVYAEVELPNDGRPGWVRTLCFSKEGSLWKLMVEAGPKNGEVEAETLRNSSKATRMLGVQYLPALLKAMFEAKEIETGIVELNVGKVEAFIEFTKSLRGK